MPSPPESWGPAEAPPRVTLARHPSPHPFVRRHFVARAPEGLPPGAVVTLVLPDGTVLGDAFYNPRSDIAARRLTTGEARFDHRALEVALERAVALRAALPGLAGATDAWRVVHAEGDALSGLVIDRYGEVLVLELYSAGWIDRADEIVALLAPRVGTRHARVSMGERVAHLEGVAPLHRATEGCPRRVAITEHGVRYHVDLELGHKTGFFCDQRDNRAELARRLRGGDVLDVCCNTGGFALAAAVSGRAATVTGVELDEKALEIAKANANLNQRRVSFVRADAFDWMRQVGRTGRRFEAVVVDPPKFVPTRSDVETGQGKYRDLNRLALELLAPGGLVLTCSCSGLVSRDDFLRLIQAAARKAGRTAQVLGWAGAGGDHPVLLECPETEYLKGLWLRVW